jgi:hypothetical protein
MIAINFTLSQPDGGYKCSDTLLLKDDHGLTDVEIEAMKQARYDKWYDYIINPPPVIEAPVEPEEE